MDTCWHCGKENIHYMTHVCSDCSCRYIEVSIPGEPHIPPYLEAEPDPHCLVHGDFMEAVRRTNETLYPMTR